MTHIYSVCDGGQDNKQYSHLAHLSDKTITQMRIGGKGREKEERRRKENEGRPFCSGLANSH